MKKKLMVLVLAGILTMVFAGTTYAAMYSGWGYLRHKFDIKSQKDETKSSTDRKYERCRPRFRSRMKMCLKGSPKAGITTQFITSIKGVAIANGEKFGTYGTYPDGPWYHAMDNYWIMDSKGAQFPYDEQIWAVQDAWVRMKCSYGTWMIGRANYRWDVGQKNECYHLFLGKKYTPLDGVSLSIPGGVVGGTIGWAVYNQYYYGPFGKLDINAIPGLKFRIMGMFANNSMGRRWEDYEGWKDSSENTLGADVSTKARNINKYGFTLAYNITPGLQAYFEFYIVTDDDQSVKDRGDDQSQGYIIGFYFPRGKYLPMQSDLRIDFCAVNREEFWSSGCSVFPDPNDNPRFGLAWMTPVGWGIQMCAWQGDRKSVV